MTPEQREEIARAACALEEALRAVEGANFVVEYGVATRPMQGNAFFVRQEVNCVTVRLVDMVIV